MTDTPTTPEACSAEAKIVLARINAYDAALAEVCRQGDERTARYDAMVKAAEEKGEEWPAIPDPTPEHWAASEAWADAQKDLTDPTLARQYAALLAAHAEALERVEKLEALCRHHATVVVPAFEVKCIELDEVLERERWIPVSERLPDTKQRVLIYLPSRHHTAISVRVGKTWVGFDSPELITHWHPLPAPPAPASAGGEE